MFGIGVADDSYDNALAETVNGYYKAELIYGPAHSGPWKTIDDVELATLSWVYWHNPNASTATAAIFHQQSMNKRTYATERGNQALAEIDSQSLQQTQRDSQITQTNVQTGQTAINPRRHLDPHANKCIVTTSKAVKYPAYQHFMRGTPPEGLQRRGDCL